MKILSKLSTVVVLIFLFSTTSNAQVIITKLGIHPFHQPSLTSISDLLNMVEVNKNDIKEGLALAGFPDISDELLEQLHKTEIINISYGDGTKFDWMFYRKNGNGQVKILEDVTWVNKEPMEAFQFKIDANSKRYTFAVPLICSNLSLRGVTKAPVAIIPPPLIVAEVTEDVEVPIEVEETAEAKPVVAPVPVVAKPDVKKPKINPAIAAVPAAADLGLKLLGDLGYLHQFDPAHHLLARIGLEKALSDKFSILGLVGIAPHVSGDDGVTAYVADLMGEFDISRMFIDLGVGGWITSGDDDIEAENTQLDLILGIGSMIFGEKDDFNISLFLETRQGFNELNEMHSIKSFGRYGGGLRIRF